MAFPRPRANPLAWATNEKLTSPQENALDVLASQSISGMAADALEMESRTVIRTCNQMFAPLTASEWTTVAPSGAQCAVATVANGFYMLDIPDGATLTSLEICIAPAGVHGALPATKPTARLFKVFWISGATTQIGSTTTDAPGNVAAYELAHILGPVGGAGPTFSGLSEVIDKTFYSYYLDVSSEGGANAVAGMIFHQPRTTVTMAKLDPSP